MRASLDGACVTLKKALALMVAFSLCEKGLPARPDYASFDRAQRTTADSVDNYIAVDMIAVGETR